MLTSAPSGAVVLDPSLGVIPTVTETSAGYLVYVKVSLDCEHGGRVQISPPTAARIVITAPAADGLAAAVVVQPLRPEPFHILGSGSVSFDLRVALAS